MEYLGDPDEGETTVETEGEEEGKVEDIMGDLHDIGISKGKLPRDATKGPQ